MTTAPRRPAATTIRTAPVRAGEVLAEKYRVEAVLGAGGMGVVVAARHLQLEQDVAIKFLVAEALRDGEAVARFQREARAAVKLKSEHVARVIDVGTLESGSPYIVMELLDGLDLGQMIEAGEQLAVGAVVDYVLQACEAVAEAHACGIVHRDLKPRNLFLTSRVDGRPLVKVLDFGISKMMEQTDGSQRHFTLTGTTDVVGSPSYMSPEQLRSARSVDERTDIWSIGVILYELLTGKLPFSGENVTSIVLTIAQDAPPPIRQTRPEVPEGLEAAVMRCLEKDKAKRFSSVGELAHALEPFAARDAGSVAQRIESVRRSSRASRKPSFPAHSSARVAVSGGTSVSWGETEVGPSAAPPQRAPSRPRWSYAAAASIVVIGGAAAFWLFRPKPRVEPTRSEIAPATTQVAPEIPSSRKADAPDASAPATTPDVPVTAPSVRKTYPPRVAVPTAPTTAAGGVATTPSAGTAARPTSRAPETLPTEMPSERK